MYRAIIADDEIRICMLLRKLIDWDRLNIEIIGEYYDGEETLRAIMDDRPDIVISDIRMPKIDGLEIVKRCNDAGVDCLFLLISGHAEFEYARMAIQYNVENYLLKPVNKEELESNLVQITRHLEKNRQEELQQSNTDKRLQMDRDTLLVQMLSNMIFIPEWVKRYTLPQIKIDFYPDMNPDDICYIGALACVNKTEFTQEQHRTLLKQMMNYVRQSMQKLQLDVILLMSFPHVYFLISGKDIESMNYAIDSIMDSLKNRYFEYCVPAMGISTIVQGIERLSVVNRLEADQALRVRFNRGLGRVFYFDTLEACPDKLRVEEYVNEFKIGAEIMNADRLSKLFDLVLEKTQSHQTDLSMLFEFVEKIKDEFILRVKRLSLQSESARRVRAERDAIEYNADSKRTMLEQLWGYIRSEIDRQSEDQDQQKSKQIEKAKKYINQNYSRDISLTEISGVVYMTPNYFCSLFKKVSGMNFSDYLQETRIDEAKRLLSNTPLSVSKVAENVGYKSAHYFSKVFLKVVGIKPSEYRHLYAHL